MSVQYRAVRALENYFVLLSQGKKLSWFGCFEPKTNSIFCPLDIYLYLLMTPTETAIHCTNRYLEGVTKENFTK